MEYGENSLDTESLKPFKEVAIPHDAKSLNSQVKLVRLWNQSFSLTEDAKSEFKSLESEIKKLVVVVIDESQPLELKTDASDIALAAALNQSGRLVAFFFENSSWIWIKAFTCWEKCYHRCCKTLEKFSCKSPFYLKTDKKSLSFM